MSAASGLVLAVRRLYVAVDDENHIACFDVDDATAPGEVFEVFAGELPAGHAERKAHKPDLEALCSLPPSASLPHGALLGLGSGSTERRQRGFLWPFAPEGSLDGRPRLLDLAPLYSRAREHVKGVLNIEGACVAGSTDKQAYRSFRLLLLQRGNTAGGMDALVSIDLARFVDALNSGEPVDVDDIAVAHFDLGSLDGVRLTASDICALDDDLLACVAIAEDTDNPYDDAPCRGSVVALLTTAGEVRSSTPVGAPGLKLEGIAPAPDGSLLAVNDPDDRQAPAWLHAIRRPAG